MQRFNTYSIIVTYLELVNIFLNLKCHYVWCRFLQLVIPHHQEFVKHMGMRSMGHQNKKSVFESHFSFHCLVYQYLDAKIFQLIIVTHEPFKNYSIKTTSWEIESFYIYSYNEWICSKYTQSPQAVTGKTSVMHVPPVAHHHAGCMATLAYIFLQKLHTTDTHYKTIPQGAWK